MSIAVPGQFNSPRPPTGSIRPRRSRFAALIAGGSAILAVCALLVLRQQGIFRLGTSDRGDPPITLAKRTLSAFLSAKSPADRAACVLDGNRLLPLLQSYYSKRDEDPVNPDAFEPVEAMFESNDPGLIALQWRRDRGLPTVFACFRKTDSGSWLMDWDTWTQTLDGRFRDFIVRPAEGQQSLRVRLRSAGVSHGEPSIEVSDPFSNESSLSFRIDRPDLRAVYAAGLPAGTTRTATVELVWLNDSSSGTLKPALRRHICWGYSGLDGKIAPDIEVPTTRKYRPPPRDEASLADKSTTGKSTNTAVIGATSLKPARQ